MVSQVPASGPAVAAAALPKLLTPRQERFCHYFVAYANAARAARAAGFSAKSAKHQGYRLLRTGRVRARIRALHAELARDHGIDLDTLIGKLENLYRRSTEDGRFHTATRAVELQARLAAYKERRRGLPALPPLPLPALKRAPGEAPAEPPATDDDDPALAAIIARAEAALGRIDLSESDLETGRDQTSGPPGGPEGGSASVDDGGHAVGMGSAPGGPEVGVRSAGG